MQLRDDGDEECSSVLGSYKTEGEKNNEKGMFSLQILMSDRLKLTALTG